MTLLHSDPEQMTGRAQVYLVVAFVRHTILGVWMLVMPSRFINLEQALGGTLVPWGVSFAFVGVACLAAAVTRREHIAQTALFLSAVTTGAISVSLMLGWLDGSIVGTTKGPPSPLLWMFGFSLTAKDLIVCRQPLLSPFEPLRRQVRAARQQREADGDGDA